MSKKFRVLTNIFFISLLLLGVGVLIAADLPTVAPDEVIIDNKGYKKDKKGPVKFDHKKHSEEFTNIEDKSIECIECHHHYEDGKNVWKEGDPVKKCASADCHDPVNKIDNRPKLQLAYHQNCKDCHQALIKAGKKDKSEAPIACTKCMHD
jgi:hypothetical protein